MSFIISEMLSSYDYTVTCATTGEEAVSLLSKEMFHLILLDIIRSFLQERTDIGILCSILFSEKLLGLLLSAIGLTNVVFDFSVAAVAVPIAVVTGSFFVFAYFAAKKVKKVEVRELVTE